MLESIKTALALISDRKAVTALEYAMIAGIIVAVIAVGFGVLASDISNKFNTIGGSI
jgi:Flp pilus assembly pilin Flp